MGANGVRGQFRVVPLADEHAERPLALARVVSGRAREAPLQDGQGRGDLTVATELRPGGGLGQVAVDAALSKPAGDSLGAPAVELPAVLREPAREPLVVEAAEPFEPRQRLPQRRLGDIAALQVGADLGDRAVAGAEVAQREAERMLDPRLRIGPLGGAQAACSSGIAATAGDCSPSGRSIGFTRLSSRSSAA